MENMKNEIEKYAEVIGITVEEAQAIFDSIVADNNLDVNVEEQLLVARSVYRSNFSQARARMKKEETGGTETQTSEYTGPTYTQKVSGFFWAIDNATDWEERNRSNILAEYQRDSNSLLNSGKAAMAVQLSDGRFEVSLVLDGETKTKVMEKLPSEEPMQVDDDRWLIPVDDRKGWNNGQANTNYGKPLPAHRWQRTLQFIGKLDDGEYQKFKLRVNGEQAKDFHPRTFAMCEFDCVPNSNNASMLSARKDGSTVSSLSYLDSEENLLEIIQNLLGENISSLVALSSYHADNSHKQYDERLVITDGNVANMNLQAYDNGNRVIFLSDLNADFDYDGEGYSSTACWVPAGVDIDFGIGSNIIISGRTSQGTDAEGNLRDVSINVLGLHVIDRHGSAEVYSEPVESEDTVWFD